MSHTHNEMRGRLTDATAAYKYVLGGNATITLKSLKTGTRFTFKIEAGDGCWFVKLLNGADNERDYRYLGRIHRNMFWPGRATPRPGDIRKDAPSMVAFRWFWEFLTRGDAEGDELPASLECYHEGSCGRCGRKLTVPASIESGFGPECVKHVGGA